jgi:hypothetical protein
VPGSDRDRHRPVSPRDRDVVHGIADDEDIRMSE